jgi:hypothetical protein
LAVPVTEIAVRAVADIPGLLLAPCGAIGDAEMSATSTAYRTSLEQSRTLPRRRSARQFVALAIGREQLKILLMLLPTDVAGMSVWDASQPLPAVAFSHDVFLALRTSPVAPASIHVGTCQSRVA